ncbi:hypothetical protein D9M71_599500 [compost metagenome]
MLQLIKISVNINGAQSEVHFSAAQSQDQESMHNAAKSFLRLVDEGRVEETWDQVGSVLQEQSSKVAWVAVVRAARASLGRPLQRVPKAFALTDELPDAPPGTYGFVVYTSGAGNHDEEMIVLQPVEGDWKVVGYRVKRRLVNFD